MRPTTETRFLPVTLTEEVLAERAQQLAESVKEEEDLREKFAAWESTMKEASKAKKAGIYIAHDHTVKLGEIVESGKEGQDVACAWLYTADSAFLKRDDTGELVQVRQLREDEREAVIGEAEVIQEPTQDDLEVWAEAKGAEVRVPEGKADDQAEMVFPSGVVVDLDDKEAATREMTAFIREAFKS